MEVTIRKWKKIKSVTTKIKYFKRDGRKPRVHTGSNIPFMAEMRHLCGKTIKGSLREGGFFLTKDLMWRIEPWMCKGGKF